jgi:tetratricopeptide (TPR) repeat protein
MYEALRSINKTIARDSTQYGLFVHRSKLYKSSGNIDRAISDLSWAIELEPRRGQLYVQRGKLLLERGDKEQACNDWEKASLFGAKEGGQLRTRHCY